MERPMPDVFRKQSQHDFYRAMVESGTRPYFRALSARGTEVLVDGKRLIMVGCNDYLGLSTDPRVVAAASAALGRFGASCSGSRALNGSLALHEELEGRLAVFLGQEAAVVTTTGFQTNLAIASFLGRNDAAFGDMSNHASLVDGIRLGFGAHYRYRHSDMIHLESLLRAADPAVGKLIVTDGLFSMSGDLCRLPEIVALARRYEARVVVDSAHDIGLMGVGGRGVAEHFGLLDGVDLVTGTLSKCFGSSGGMLAGPGDVIDYLRYSARSLLFSAAMPAAAAAAGIASLDIIESEPHRRQRALDLAERLHNGLRALGYDTGQSVTPIIPVHVGDAELCLRAWQELFDAGVFTNAVAAPAVPRGRALLRVTAQATHTDDQVEQVLDAFALVGRRLGLIPGAAPEGYEPVRIARQRRSVEVAL